MDFQTFKILVSRWAAEKVIPALAPEGLSRWVLAFVGTTKAQALIEHYAPQFITMTADGKVDLDALKTGIEIAFAAQPTLKFTIPGIPQFSLFSIDEVTVSFTKEDADSLLAYLKGSTTTTEVTL